MDKREKAMWRAITVPVRTGNSQVDTASRRGGAQQLRGRFLWITAGVGGLGVESRGLVKSFYTDAAPLEESRSVSAMAAFPLTGSRSPGVARIAVYDSPAAAPRIHEIPPASVAEYIESLASHIYDFAREAGGAIPYTVVRELTENLIHADFREPVVSILDGGRTIRFADQGPGISDKEKVLLPGFTTARGEMKHYIRGVGSGLPIVREFLSVCGGALVIEDNLGCGSVVTISVPAPSAPAESTRVIVASDLARARVPSHTEALPGLADAAIAASAVRLSGRQKQVLALVVDNGSAGPSLIAKELGVGVSTAYRDLSCLEDLGFIGLADGGKRSVTDAGLDLLDELMHG